MGFKDILEVVTHLKVVNDLAERGVKLMSDIATLITNDDTETVAEEYHKAEKTNKGLSKRQLQIKVANLCKVNQSQVSRYLKTENTIMKMMLIIKRRDFLKFGR